MTKQIKVAAIPDNTRIIINYGKNDEILGERYARIGQEIEVYIQGPNIMDPDTKEIIGSYDPIIEKLELTEIYDNFSIARKIRTKTTTPMDRMIASPMLKTSTKEYAQTISVDPEDIMSPVDNRNVIRIGDLVKFV